VQGLPKTSGGIQSSYDEKMRMYSLFKQGSSVPPSLPLCYSFPLIELDRRGAYVENACRVVTEGDVKGPRPGVFDMLRRAKWSVRFTFLPRSGLVSLTVRSLNSIEGRDAWKSKEGMKAEDAMRAYVSTLVKVRSFLALSSPCPSSSPAVVLSLMDQRSFGSCTGHHRS
jgi:acyl-CoA-binding protein